MKKIPWRLLARLNIARHAGEPDVKLEEQFEARRNVSRHLAVYGSLAPGRENHHLLAGARGRWREGLHVEGDLRAEGWGAALGYPALRLRRGGARVPVWLLESAALPALWPSLDEFEGPGYRRALAPVRDQEGKLVALANLYEAAAAK
jgi:gamma-glutamylcyclotransferase (GGCT)/AIG2-like uncharacterized protein YtfP